jgi:uncharacterized membrane protein
MLWLYLALLAYFINAVAFIIDKHLLASYIPKPLAYAFGISVLSILAVVLIPFGVFWLGLGYFVVAFVSGAAFFVALFFLYSSVKDSDASLASTNVGTLSAIFTYIFSVLILHNKLGLSNGLAFAVLLAGLLFIGLVRRDIIKYSMLSGIFFGLSIVLLKLTFNTSDFVNAIFWTRVGFFGSALFILVFSSARKDIYDSFRGAPRKSMLLFVLNKIISAVGFGVYYYAVSIGEVSLISALLGIQFIFIFILAIVLQNKLSGVSEDVKGKVLAGKVIGIALIVSGFIMLIRK